MRSLLILNFIYHKNIISIYIQQTKMKKKTKKDVFLSWSKLSPISEGQDPLGLNLRVSARLSSQLLYCITSITPRARYYSFLPWCIKDYIDREKGRKSSRSIREAIKARERLFSLSCIAWHKGDACDDGRLIGSDTLSLFYEKVKNNDVNQEDIEYVKIPAIDAYGASLAGLKFYDLAMNHDESLVEEEIKLSFDDIKLSELGNRVADAYGRSIDNLPVIKQLLTRKKFPVEYLSQWGKQGGLCELRDGSPPDQKILRDIFFNKKKFRSRSHEYRGKSLTLLLKVTDLLAKEGVALNEHSFNDAVYFDSINRLDGSVKRIIWHSHLKDIVNRWKIFHFHYYLSYSLETIFVNIVNKARSKGLEGFKLNDFIGELGTKSVNNSFQRIFQNKSCDNFLEISPRVILKSFGVDIKYADKAGSMKLEKEISYSHVLSERNLINLIEEESLFFKPEGTITALILLIIVLIRYIKWEDTSQGNWLGQAIDDNYKDLTAPNILYSLNDYYGDFWNTQWKKVAYTIINRFVVRHHEIVALDKSWSGNSSFFHTDQDIIRWRNMNYDNPGCGNPRFPSAVLILKDLNLLRSDPNDKELIHLTPDGKSILNDKLSDK